jgi:drug/metabolite transporter (DMT)-like permease
MIAVLGGLGAACCWTVTSVFAQKAGRTIGEFNTFAWGCVFGLVLAIVPSVLAIVSQPPSERAVVALIAAGVCNVIGLLALFGALRRGQISVVTPITACEGAVAAVISTLAGAHLAALGWLGLGVLATGVAVSVTSHLQDDSGPSDTDRAMSIGLAVVAALIFGTGLFFQGKAGDEVPLGLAIIPGCLVGTVAVAAPMGVAGRLKAPGSAAPWLLSVAVAEILGFVSYVLGARHSVPVAAVLAAQYASISSLIGIVFLRERLTPVQMLGLVLTIAGVAVVSLQS